MKWSAPLQQVQVVEVGQEGSQSKDTIFQQSGAKRPSGACTSGENKKEKWTITVSFLSHMCHLLVNLITWTDLTSLSNSLRLSKDNLSLFSSVPWRAGVASVLLVTLIEDAFVRRIVMTVTCSHLPGVFYLGEGYGSREPPCRIIPTVSFHSLIDHKHI